ncbi:MAG: DUF2085 domain-containing protein [Chloroflexota bacterium]
MLRTQAQREVLSRRITYLLTHVVRCFGAHWLAVANLALVLYVGLPFLAPVLMESGHEGAARLIYTVFRPLCHQLPERSFFLLGPQSVYSHEELTVRLGGWVPSRYIGALELGFKVAVCQRCVAIYGVMLLAGLLFGLVRRHVPPLSLIGFGLLILPTAIDGGGQLVGLWTSTWWLRLLTGALFGIACVWLTYPHIERGMREVHAETGRTLREWSD